MLKGKEFKYNKGARPTKDKFDTYIYGLGATVIPSKDCKSAHLKFFFKEIEHKKDAEVLSDAQIVQKIIAFDQSYKYCELNETFHALSSLAKEKADITEQAANNIQDKVRELLNANLFWNIFGGTSFSAGSDPTPLDIKDVERPAKIVIFLMFENWVFTHSKGWAVDVEGGIGRYADQQNLIKENDIFAGYAVIDDSHVHSLPPQYMDRIMRCEYWFDTNNFPYDTAGAGPREFKYNIHFNSINSSTRGSNIVTPITIDPKIINNGP